MKPLRTRWAVLGAACLVVACADVWGFHDLAGPDGGLGVEGGSGSGSGSSGGTDSGVGSGDGAPVDSTMQGDGASGADASLGDSAADSFVEGSVDGSTDVSALDAQEEGPAALCCRTQAGANDCPSPPAVYPCNGLASSPGAMCATDGGTITIGSSGGPNQGSAPCWALGGDSGTWAQCEFGQTACCGATTVGACE
jgi:hypothetical protein